nr:ATP synthase F0 subunit 8 [Xenostrobus securis]UZG65994.1 ATP synthase F0 subunit 8 [Xenostrobus securis]
MPLFAPQLVVFNLIIVLFVLFSIYMSVFMSRVSTSVKAG